MAVGDALFLGDNLSVLRAHVADASVDLVYLDPPFNSNKAYASAPRRATRAVAAGDGGARVDAPAPKILGFDDTWRWDARAEAAFEELRVSTRSPAKLPALLAALRLVLGEGDLLAYLVMMAGRLVELHRVLAPTGGLYLHCDPTASHYLKVVLDVVFGPGTFQNEVVWRYRRWPTRARRFQKMHDVLFYYAKSGGGEHTFHTLYGYEKLADSTLKTFDEEAARGFLVGASQAEHHRGGDAGAAAVGRLGDRGDRADRARAHGVADAEARGAAGADRAGVEPRGRRGAGSVLRLGDGAGGGAAAGAEVHRDRRGAAGDRHDEAAAGSGAGSTRGAVPGATREGRRGGVRLGEVRLR